MNYLKYNEENYEVSKYEISVDTSKLEKMKYEIIDKCSFIKHVEGIFRGDDLPPQSLFDNLIKYRNLSKRFIKTLDDYDIEYYPVEHYNLYEASYDEYIYPKIIKYINEILRYCKENDTNIIKSKWFCSIYEWDFDDEFSFCDVIKEHINTLNEVLLDDSVSIDKKKKTLEEIKEWSINYDLNKKQVLVKNYKQELCECFSLKKIESIHYIPLLEAYQFLDPEVKDVIKPYIPNNIFRIIKERGEELKPKVICKQFDKII